MTVAHPSIRQLYEQVRVLESEAARPVRRRRLPYAFVLMAAAAIGAASADVSHPTVRREPLRAAAPVVHLIDQPAERARALPAAAPQRAHVQHRVAAPAVPRSVHVAARIATPSAHTARASRIAPPAAQRVSAPQRVSPLHRITPQHKTDPARPRPHLSVAPVGVGPVAVTASEEPQPEPPGATTTGP